MTTWLWLGLVVYLLVFAFNGRLAFMVDAQAATLELGPSVPACKKPHLRCCYEQE